MRRIAFAVVAVVASLDTGAAARGGSEPQPPSGAIAHLRAHVDFLADDRLRGRDTGSAEHGIAALYAASRFAKWGLVPGAGGSFLQPVRFVESRVESPSLVARRAGGRVELEKVSDYVLLGSVSAERLSTQAQVVFAGYGIDAPELDLRDYAAIDVRGKIVLLLSGAPASFPNDQRAHYSSRRLKAETAERAGAVGLLTLRDRVDEERVSWSRIADHADKPRTAWIHPDGTIADAFPGLAFAATLSRAGAAKLFDGTGLTYDSIQDSAAKLDYLPRPLPIHFEIRGRAKQTPIESANVAAILAGSDPNLRNEFVIVSAHLDHIGVGTPVEGDSIYNGYFDNAIGSSILLETARRLAEAPQRPRRSVLFLLVTAEERGLLGSDYFAHHPTVAPDAIVANVNVDMPLFFAPLVDLVAFGGEHSTLGALTAEVAAAHGLALVPDPMPAEVIFVRSDQYSFVRRGVPAIYLNPGPAISSGSSAQRDAVGDFIAKHYHRPSDQAGLPIDWSAAAKFTALQIDLVRRIADEPERPTWNAGDFFGDAFGKR